MKIKNLTVQDGSLSAEILSDSGKTYVVILTDSGEQSCSCMDSFMRRRQCKHMQHILDRAESLNMLKDNRGDMEINRPFESLTNDELWNAILKRRTSFRQRQLQFELVYRLHHLEGEAEHWKELAEIEREARDQEQQERERIEKLYMEGP